MSVGWCVTKLLSTVQYAAAKVNIAHMKVDMDKKPIHLTIDWRDENSKVPEAHQERLTQSVYRTLRSIDGVRKVDRVPDSGAPAGNMGAQWLWNILTAEIPGDGFRIACKEALNQLEGLPVDISVTVNGQVRSIQAKNVHPDDVDRILEKLTEAVQKMRDKE